MMKTCELINDQPVAIEEINQILEVGRLLFAVLTPEEDSELEVLICGPFELGNTGDS